MEKTIKSSFSQHNTFEKCPRHWYYQYILKLKVPANMMYAHAGSVIHSCIESYYNGNVKNLDMLKEKFNILWNNYKLDETDLKLKKDLYYLMCINAVNLALPIKKCEMHLNFNDVQAYLDVVTIDDEIGDWKSSTRRGSIYDDSGNLISEGNEEEYKKQLMLYAWLYWRKFNILPSKVMVHYLKYSGSKQELYFIPVMNDIYKAEDWYYNILNKMNEILKINKVPPMSPTCHFFCPYKNICGSGNSPKLTLHIWGDHLKLDGPITDLLHKGIHKKFSYELKDAFFIKKRNSHAKTTVEFWNPHQKELPIGFKQGLLKTLNDFATFKNVKFNLQIVEHREFNNEKIKMPDKFLNDKILRDYQNAIVKVSLREKIGAIQAGTGGGKTECFIELLRQTGYASLILVEKIELLNQNIDRIKNSLGIEVGKIGGSKYEPNHITVATIQTLIKKLDFHSRINIFKKRIKDKWVKNKIEEFVKENNLVHGIKNGLISIEATTRINKYGKEVGKKFKFTKEDNELIEEVSKLYYNEYIELINYLKSIRFLIIEECHHSSCRSIQKICSELINTEFRLGFSATVSRDDGNQMMIEGVLGKIVYNLSSDKLIREGYLIKPIINFYKNYMTKEEVKDLEQKCKDGLINETPNYNNFYVEFIVNNIKRNNLIKDIVDKNKSKKILILVKRIEHGNLLEDQIEGSKYLHGGTNKNERKQLLEDFTSGKINILISTISILAEGVDIPSLDMVINAAANKGNIKTIQVLGRVLRKLEGKENAYYIDFIDPVNFFRVASSARKKILLKEGHEVEIIEELFKKRDN